MFCAKVLWRPNSAGDALQVATDRPEPNQLPSHLECSLARRGLPEAVLLLCVPALVRCIVSRGSEHEQKETLER